MHESHYGRGKLEGKTETVIQMIQRKFNKSLSKEDEIYVVTKIHQASTEHLFIQAFAKENDRLNPLILLIPN